MDRKKNEEEIEMRYIKIVAAVDGIKVPNIRQTASSSFFFFLSLLFLRPSYTCKHSLLQAPLSLLFRIEDTRKKKRKRQNGISSPH